jgi:hypothetical protein
MTKACPDVCMTALAISKLAALIRTSISTQSAARASGTGVPPGGDGGLLGGQRVVDVRHRVLDAELGTPGRALGRDPVDRARLAEVEPTVEERLEGVAARRPRRLAVDARGSATRGRPRRRLRSWIARTAWSSSSRRRSTVARVTAVRSWPAGWA